MRHGWRPPRAFSVGIGRPFSSIDPDIGRATALFKDGRREFRGASLVSLHKLDRSKANPQAGTFPSLFKSEDADALAFIARRHGLVRLADTIVQFNEPGRAIMRDGLYDDGLVRTHRAADPSTFKIGKDAQVRALREMAEKAEQLVESETAKSDAAAKLADSAHVQLRRFFDEQLPTFQTVTEDYAKSARRRTRSSCASHRWTERAMAAYEASVKSSAILNAIAKSNAKLSR